MSKKSGSKLLSRRDLATVMSVHPDTITGWHDAGLPIAVRGGRGRQALYDPAAVRAWKAAREEAAAQAATDPVDAFRERARKDRAQAMLAEQLYLQRAGKLLDADLVTKTWTGEYAAVRTILLASYTSAVDRVHRAATLEGTPGVERELKAIAFAALREISDPGRSDAPAKRRPPTRKRKARR